MFRVNELLDPSVNRNTYGMKNKGRSSRFTSLVNFNAMFKMICMKKSIASYETSY